MTCIALELKEPRRVLSALFPSEILLSTEMLRSSSSSRISLIFKCRSSSASSNLANLDMRHLRHLPHLRQPRSLRAGLLSIYMIGHFFIYFQYSDKILGCLQGGMDTSAESLC